ncbi:MAG: adenosylmethionine--8-amino-7-oxononanoate transaminase [Bacteroidia bacterium]|nr:adenosylmethionine--8-amino-7-oxononanoate transaminase [Bacteroidia bacterium]
MGRKSHLFNWHPFTPGMNDSPEQIKRGKGQYLYGSNNRKYFDAVSSWWTCTHGHGQPEIVRAVQKQIAILDHVMFAGYTHSAAEECSRKLLTLLPAEQEKVFYSDNGSTAVEVAVKMALQFWKNKKKIRRKILALKGGYHGDTFGAMSAGISSGFFYPFREYLFDVQVIDPADIRNLAPVIKGAAALIYEPLVQGAAGMKMTDPGKLEELLHTCRRNGILLIADEVFSGFGRTGTLFASEQIEIKPDIYCFSKGLTGGVMALGATVVSSRVAIAFRSHDPEKMLRHGHSYTANPVACSAASASLGLHLRRSPDAGIRRITSVIKELSPEAGEWKRVKESRALGTILAIEVAVPQGYFKRSLAEAEIYFRKRGTMLRPIGNVIYMVPPYCSRRQDLVRAFEQIRDFIRLLK